MINKKTSNEWFQITPQTEYLLVVEKEGIFHRLCEDRFYKYVRTCLRICAHTTVLQKDVYSPGYLSLRTNHFA